MNKNIGNRFSDGKETINFYRRITCFTETYTNLLMWSHYASSHTGFCIGYSKSEIKSVCNKFNKINYCNEMPITIVDGENFKVYNRFNKIIYSNCVDWSYENEWRAVYNIREDNISASYIEEYFSRFEDKEFIYYCTGILGKHEYVKSPSIIIKECKPKVIYI